MENGVGGGQLGLGGIQPGLRGQRLQIGAAHRQHHQVARVRQAVLAGAGAGAGGAVIIDRGQVGHRLAEGHLKIVIIERAHHGRHVDTGEVEVQAERGQVHLLHGFVERAVQVRQQGAARHPHLRAGLVDGIGEPDRAQVVDQAAVQGIIERQPARKLQGGSAGCAAAVGAGDRHGRVEGVDAGGGSGHGLFGHADRAALVVASGSRQDDRLRRGRGTRGLAGHLCQGAGRAQQENGRDNDAEWFHGASGDSKLFTSLRMASTSCR